MIKIIVRCLVMMVATTSWAASSIPSASEGTDISLLALTKLGLFPGRGDHIAEHLSSQFSTILFLIVGILWTYITFTSILKTASEGQFLGQKWSSMWIPIRMVLGMVLLMPKGKTGYTVIQALVMSVVTHGVDAANLALRYPLAYLERGSIFVEPFHGSVGARQNVSEELKQHNEKHAQTYLLDEAGKLLKSEVCMIALDYLMEQKNYNKHFMGESVRRKFMGQSDRFVRTLNLEGEERLDKKREILFPKVWDPGLCGAIHWAPGTQLLDGDRSVLQPDVYKIVVQQMVYSLLPSAKRIADKVLSSSEKQEETEEDKHQELFPLNVPLVSPTTSQRFTQGEDFKLVQIAQNATSMIRIALQDRAKRKEILDKNEFQKVKEDIQAAGWVVLGSYYWFFTKINKALHGIETDWLTIQNEKRIFVTEPNNYDRIKNYFPDKIQQNNFEHCLEELDNFIGEEKQRLINYEQNWNIPPAHPLDKSEINHWLLKLLKKESILLQQFMQSAFKEEKDPIIALSMVGKKLLNAMADIWEKTNNQEIRFPSLQVEQKDTHGNWSPVTITNSIAKGLENLAKIVFLLPILGTWMLLNFVLGAILVYYLPLVPFLLWYFGTLTWFGLVIVAFIASLLVPLGLMNPDGPHEIFSQAEPGLKLLANLFLRPMLMVFGLIFGMMFCTVAFQLFHYGYSIALKEILSEKEGVLVIITQITTTTIYATVAVSIVTRCFALIYEIPNRVFSWIGWQVEGHSEADILSQVKGGMDQHIGSIASSTNPVSQTKPGQSSSRMSSGSYTVSHSRDN